MTARRPAGVFDEDPELYDRARPGYPAALFDELDRLVGIGPGRHVLEIGPGTGQATTALADRGADVVAVERGPALAALLRRRVGGSVQVVEGMFEDWTPQGRRFDVVTAFTAWHWLDPATRADKAASLLRPGGALATVMTHHVAGGSRAFFAEVQDCYARWDRRSPAGPGPRAAAEVPPALDEVDGSDGWEPATRHRFEQEISYSTEAYLDLVSTYSGHRTLGGRERAGLFSCIAALADRHGGRITKRYLCELRVACRRLGRAPPP